MTDKYIGREKNLAQLRALEHKNKASLVVIKGRRRIGKSRLAEEFGKDKIFIPFTGYPPTDDATNQDQLNSFAEQLCLYFKMSARTFLSWSDAFNALGSAIKDNTDNKLTVVLFDEISWMAHKSPKFLGQLKIWWDLNHSKFPNLILILCGSISSWIEENILKSTAFFGRISLEINLLPLTIPECAEFLRQNDGFKGSSYEYYKILSVVGGIPWYLEQITHNKMADLQIIDLCFQPNGKLVNEFDRIFHDLFGQHGAIYKKIIQCLQDGMRTQAEIRETLKYPRSGTLGKHLHNLIVSGFVTEHFQWSLKTSKIGRQSQYRLNDQYVRFFLKYIEPNLPTIQQGVFDTKEVVRLPGWDSIMGLQVESLLLQNRALILESLEIKGQDIVADNPYLQKAGTRKKGCQIDYLIQTNQRSLFVCEFKFNRREIGPEIISSMTEKLKNFSAPDGFAKIPVLFHLGDVSESVYTNKFFYRVVNIGDYLGV
jgi:AAA+ ATPase superfamily predicted ATPase